MTEAVDVGLVGGLSDGPSEDQQDDGLLGAEL